MDNKNIFKQVASQTQKLQQENFDKSKKLDNDQAVDNLLNQADKLLNKPAKQIQAKKEGKATGLYLTQSLVDDIAKVQEQAINLGFGKISIPDLIKYGLVYFKRFILMNLVESPKDDK
ncbi:hypothetical protein FCM44_03335 [Mycoplasma bovis]|uniref:Uncharacterized protein n=1 Tax=Mycoplasmopsis bovis (strain ATCC 25523 / DSM 22781 / NCTC 10131 / PG45) TaxID=289397 RepID=A0A454AQF6_MYCBG|nr:hypothetical protein [Mycoplasmopsis bovis]ADR25292.1 hypothetical protein (ICEB-2 encoded) [Mycoplasmopsis bovis PG45]MBT1368718.1 hypothetical protein [Mycoplasmopsis bovis]MBT1421155.1 hypothetical protein [Mycoplasmopsis bovis]MCA8840847.1 hypothetical protein [Mycoplasmopsis bovis]MCA8841591.1 hypothetical protein [Mycoplasmopsis bovis]